jgi:hypothetical protein
MINIIIITLESVMANQNEEGQKKKTEDDDKILCTR